MGAKGAVDTTIDVNELSGLIVFANRYSEEVSSASDEIRSICRSMEDEESLKGGDGDEIREQFAAIAQGCQNIDKSVKYIVSTLNEKLQKALQMNKGKTSAESGDAIQAAVNKAGVLKKE